MLKRLGQLEMVTLLAVLQSPQPAYAVTIAREIEQRAGRRLARGALHVTLSRLVDKGLLDSWLADEAPSRGGRRRRHYAATAAGLRSATAARSTLRSLWDGLDVTAGPSS